MTQMFENEKIFYFLNRNTKKEKKTHFVCIFIIFFVVFYQLNQKSSKFIYFFKFKLNK